MQSYIQTFGPTSFPQILSVNHNSDTYYLDILHSSVTSPESSKHRASNCSEHSHDVYHIVLYLEGENFCMINGRKHPTSPGTLILTDPTDSHNFHPINRGKTKYIECTFQFVTKDKKLRLPFDQLLSAYSGIKLTEYKNKYLLNKINYKTLREQIESAIDNMNEGGSIDIFEAYLTMNLIFAFLVRTAHSHPVENKTTLNKGLHAARWEIEHQFREKLSLEKLAIIANRSPSHFIRSFKKKFGASPIEYQISIKIKAAKNLLLNSNYRCQEIAARCGFNDEYYFSKTFKKHTGVSPTKYRNHNR